MSAGKFTHTVAVLCCIFVVASCDGHFENVAVYKDCSISQNWNGGSSANNAVNNNTDGLYRSDSNCIHTKSEYVVLSYVPYTYTYRSWWEVDLGRSYPVRNITVWARNNFNDRMQDCVITVDGDECYTFSEVPATREISVTCNEVVTGRVVRVSKDSQRSDGGGTINMCEFQVFSCSDDYWDSGCDKRCGNCSNGEVCDKVTGHCSTCSSGWTNEPLCDQECSNGTFGHRCNQTCSEGCDDVCHKVTGNCTCRSGWQGHRCDEECPLGTYGLRCAKNCSAHCEDICQRSTGFCNCKIGYLPPNCTQECSSGTFGHRCNKTCSEGCDDVCDKVSGNCTCRAGWQGHRCDEECPLGTYGLRCAKNCSTHCEDICQRSTGFCNCKIGYLPPNCTQEVMSAAMDSDDSSDSGVIAGAAGGGVVAVVTAVLVVVGIVIIRRRRSQAKGATREDNTRRNQSISSGHSDDNVYYNIDHPVTTTAPKPAPRVRPTKEHKPKRASNKAPSPNTKGVSYANVTFTNKGHDPDTGLYLNVDLGSTVRSRSAALQHLDEPEVQEVEEEEVDPEERGRDEDELRQRDVYYNDDVYMTSEATDAKLDATQQFLLEKLRGTDLDQEFKDLPQGLIKDHSTGADRENYYRNRFTTILPYEENRVVLQGVPDPGSNDYINASYIPGPQSPKQYIAAQGPRPNTVGDFWKMVWQEKVATIVMLTNLKEGKKKKCALYWPLPGKHDKYGSVDVTGREARQRANYVMRTFDVKMGNEACRHVTQYHYTTWPDHGAPNATALVDLWRTVRHGHTDQQPPSPLLVHCSAGVGRTGTYIALDIVMDRLQQQTQPIDDLGVFQVVKDLRNSRCHMVQAKSQYVVLHEALLEAYSSLGCRIPLLTFDSVFRHCVDPHHGNSRIDTQFMKLKQMKVLLHRPSRTVAEHEDNINKNRSLDVLPDDRHLVRTMVPEDGRNDYINAVRLETIGGATGYLLTQLPLTDTMVDLWRLVIGSDVSLIISLGSDADDSECFQVSELRIALNLSSDTDIHMFSYMEQLEGMSEAKQVTLLHYADWKGDLPGNLQEFVQLLDCVRATKPPTERGNSPVLIQCKNGASKSGLFAVTCDVISQMTSECMLDAYTAVRNMHMVRPECMTSKVQYRYIFTMAQQYRSRNDIYHNA